MSNCNKHRRYRLYSLMKSFVIFVISNELNHQSPGNFTSRHKCVRTLKIHPVVLRGFSMSLNKFEKGT